MNKFFLININYKTQLCFFFFHNYENNAKTSLLPIHLNH